MSRPFRLWVRCPPDEQNPDGFRIAETYIQFSSAIRAGRRMAGPRNFHIDHHSPDYVFCGEEQVVEKIKRSNGKFLYKARQVRARRDSGVKVLRILHL